MTTWGVTMVRDEADIIAYTVAHMLTQMHHVVVADNLSSDGTTELLAKLESKLPGLIVVQDDEPAHYQGEKMTRLADFARERGATWVVPFDADEWWYSPFGRIADVLAELTDYSLATAALYDHVATGADDPAEPNPYARIGWRRRNPSPLHKVAVRTSPSLRIEEGNHGAHYGAWGPRTVDGQLIVRHFPYRSAEQMTGKALRGAAALEATNLPYSTGQHWRDYAALERARPGAIGEVFRRHFYCDEPDDSTLIYDPVTAL